MLRIVIIGGFGVYDFVFLINIREEIVEIFYGMVKVKIGEYNGEEIVFFVRYGEGYSVLLYKINYCVNIWVFYEFGVERIFLILVVGFFNLDRKFGDFVIFD